MKTIIEILLGAFLGFIYLKPVFGVCEFPPYIEPNQVKIVMEVEPTYFARADLQCGGTPDWMLFHVKTNKYGVHIIMHQTEYKTKLEWLEQDFRYPSPFSYLDHKPETAFFRLGDEKYIAQDFEVYQYVPVHDPLYHLKTANRLYIVFPTGKVWRAVIQEYSEYVRKSMQMESSSASSSSNPQMRRRGKSWLTCMGVPRVQQ